MAKILHVLVIFVLWNAFPKVVEPSMNLALGKPTSQSSTFHQFVSGKAVDGNTNQSFVGWSCAHTDTDQLSAWWQVDLGNIADIKRIKIFYRKEDFGDNSEPLQRLNGYSIHIDSQLCYQDPVDVLPSSLTVQHDCSFQGRYVNMSIESNPILSNPIVNLCEFEVYGCIVGFYGNNNCETPCGNGCDNSKCDPDDGTCTCFAGWRGDKCTERACPTGEYGNPCKPCPSGCLNGVCDVTHGYCTSGCNQGSHGSKCDLPCPTNCAGGTCIKDTGYCDGCNDSYHSTDCSLECSVRCKDSLCFQSNGSCIGCDGFFTGTKCTDCINGKHGEQCNKFCESGCKGNACYRNDGTCVDGCTHKNMTGSTCDGCINGLYGETCTMVCPNNCDNHTCNKNSGHCALCKGTFAGSTCSDCQPKYHGPLCNDLCPKNCNKNICRKTNGKCDGCIVGYYGEYCNKTCSSCLPKGCQQSDGICSGTGMSEACPSITGPVIGTFCATLVLVGMVHLAVIMIRRWRTKQPSSNYEDTTKSGGNSIEQTYEEIKKSNIYTNDAFYGSSLVTAESTEQVSDKPQNYEIPEVENKTVL